MLNLSNEIENFGTRKWVFRCHRMSCLPHTLSAQHQLGGNCWFFLLEISFQAKENANKMEMIIKTELCVCWLLWIVDVIYLFYFALWFFAHSLGFLGWIELWRQSYVVNVWYAQSFLVDIFRFRWSVNANDILCHCTFGWNGNRIYQWISRTTANLFS